ncbi:hypothetical protein FB446DRAFT_391379 [Lentinula raphanica]|nr:hypothetical protein FB446DRAFT_391379 [Lentinula raphanica]
MIFGQRIMTQWKSRRSAFIWMFCCFSMMMQDIFPERQGVGVLIAQSYCYLILPNTTHSPFQLINTRREFEILRRSSTRVDPATVTRVIYSKRTANPVSTSERLTRWKSQTWNVLGHKRSDREA